MTRKICPISAVLVVVLSGCGGSGPGSQAGRFSPAQLRAEFPADLGSASVDVSAYPAAQKANYQVFLEKCSKCHSPARAVNAPFIDKATWVRYVFLMHDKSRERFKKPLFDGEEGKQVIEFLACDSRERKLNHAQEFLREQDRLRRSFDQIQEERTWARRVMGAWATRPEAMWEREKKEKEEKGKQEAER